MARLNADLLAFNRGIVSPLALARVDVERTRLSAATMRNWLPKTQGPMRIRPGTKYLGSSKSDAAAKWIPFVAQTDDTALIELTDGAMRVWIDDALLTRPVVSTAISNGTFASSSGWTDGSTGGVGSSSVIDLIPVMTGQTTAGVTITASSQDNGDDEFGWKVGDGNTSSNWWSDSAPPEWVKVDFGSGNTKTVASYSIRVTGVVSAAPGDWTLEGSNDNSSWTTEDTRSGVTWSSGQTRTYTVASPSAWRYYRLNISAIAGSYSEIGIAELSLYPAAGAGQVQFTASGLVLNATAIGSVAKVTREVTVGGGDANVEHTLIVRLARGPVTFRCGSSAGADDYIGEASLGTGEHHLSFTPIANFHLTFQSDALVDRIVTAIDVAGSGVMEIVSPWAAANLGDIRFDQSADVLYVDCHGVMPKKIERRGIGRSWSIVDYVSDYGPFRSSRSAAVKLKVAATFGNTTLTSDLPFFTPDHVGALFTLFHHGQSGVFIFGAADVYSPAVKMTGIGATADTAERRLKIVTSGTFSATMTVQKSVDGPDIGFHDTSTAITTATTTNIDDDNDNVDYWYRLKIKSGGYTSGAPLATITYNNGGMDGVCRVIGYVSPTEVTVEVLERFSATTYSDDWREGYWSPSSGYPTAVGLHEGRLFHAGGAMIFGSVADDYENFDLNVEGEAGPIVRSLGRGPVDRIHYLLPLLRLVVGTTGAELALRAGATDDILTPDNSSAKPISTQGSASLPAVGVDGIGIFVQRSGRRVFAVSFSDSVSSLGDYQSIDLTDLVPELLDAGVVDIAVQRQPDTRIHVVLADGTVAILTFENAEEAQLRCWSTYDTDGAVEGAVVLPGLTEDRVYYHVRRTIDAVTKRYLERWALESECEGGALNFLADCAVSYEGAATATISGLGHLEGADVVVWADGADLTPDDASGAQQLMTVSGGAIVLDAAKTNVVVGLPYDADYRSTKLAYGAQFGTALTQPKRVTQIGFILTNVHNNGLFFGRDFDALDALPRLYRGEEVDPDDIFADYDEAAVAFPGDVAADFRICLRAKAPRPVTVMAAVPTIQTNENV